MFIATRSEDRVIRQCPNGCPAKSGGASLTSVSAKLAEAIWGKPGKYCYTCGTLLVDKRIPVPPVTKCGICGESLLSADAYLFCPYCGSPRE